MGDELQGRGEREASEGSNGVEHGEPASSREAVRAPDETSSAEPGGARIRRRQPYRLDATRGCVDGTGTPYLAGEGFAFPELLRALQRQEELREASARAAEAVDRAERERREPPPRDEWRRLWDEMEGEAAAPQRGWDPGQDLVDPTSADASPEIEEWERHWPTQPKGEAIESVPKAGFARLRRWLARIWRAAVGAKTAA